MNIDFPIGEISAAQLHFVTNRAETTVLILCVNTSAICYNFRAGAKAFVNIALSF